MKSFLDGLIDNDEKVASCKKHMQTKINAMFMTKMAENPLSYHYPFSILGNTLLPDQTLLELETNQFV